MQILSIDSVEPGRRLAKSIYGENDQILLQRGAILEKKYIERLKELGFTYLYVHNDLVDDIVLHETISEQTRQQAINHLRDVTKRINDNKVLRVASLKKVVSNIIDEITENKDMMLSLANISSHDNYTFNHSVNVTVIALMIGMCLHYSREKLEKLGLGVLLHDIGKINVPLEILNKPGKLTEEEFHVIKQHAWQGFEMLRGNSEICITSAHVAFQHHERYDGSGYPRGLKGNKIIEFARIAAIADVYDAMSSDRCYRQRLSPDEVYRFLQQGAGSDFDARMLDRFIQKIALYPQGMKVRLNNGFMGIVIKQNSMAPERPLVRLFYRPDGSEMLKPTDVNLLFEENLSIVKLDDPFWST